MKFKLSPLDEMAPRGRRRLSVLACIALFLSVSACRKSDPVSPEKEKGLSRLSTSGNRIVDASGTPVILRGINRTGLEYDKNGNRISEEEIRFICTQWKARVIRLPFNQDWVANDLDYLNFMDRVIGWINQAGAYAMIDLHWEDTTVRIPPIPNVLAAFMWQTLAARYRDNPGVLYDIHNEAHNTTWTAWRNRAVQIIEAIREVHPDALILVCGLDWAYDLRGWEADPLPFENIVYSTHPYPFKGEPWAWDKYFGRFAETHPVIAGEFGGGEADLVWGRRLIRYFNDKQMGWAAWSWVDSPHLTRDDRRTPTAFGRLVRLALQRHAGVDSVRLALTDLAVRNPGRDHAMIAWKTSAPADSKVRYGMTEAYTDSVHAAVEVPDHAIRLSGLSPGTTYHYRVVSRDWYGDVVHSGDAIFETLP